jgi:hypothetical protein
MADKPVVAVYRSKIAKVATKSKSGRGLEDIGLDEERRELMKQIINEHESQLNVSMLPLMPNCFLA